MSKDVKIEIIYFKTDTDVSLEFGLHGDYPVRLLSSSSNDLPEFFKLLKRAVSRSEILITVGGYSEEEFLPLFIARAINKEPSVPEYNKLGVITEQKYSLPEGAIPLASTNKRFGGFLIESGPQTIISLTENRKIRLNIIENIIVKYIEEHHNFFANGYSVPVSTDTEPQPMVDLTDFENNSSNNEENIPTEFEEISSVSQTSDIVENTDVSGAVEISENTETEDAETVETTIENHENDNVFETENPSVPSEMKNEATESVDIVSQKYIDPESQILEDISPDDFDFNKPGIPEIKNMDIKPVKTRPQRRFLRIMCIVLSLLIIVCTSVTVFVLNNDDSVKVNTDNDYYKQLVDIYGSHGEDYAGAFNALKLHNENIEAWIELEGSELNYPVLKINIVDNFYHNHLPNGAENVQGSVFTSANIGSESLTHNTLIYGSAESGLGVFSAVVDLFNNTELDTISKLTLTNTHGSTDWRIFALFTETEADGFVFEMGNFDTEAKFNAFVRQLIRHNRTELNAVLENPTAPVITLVAVKGNKRYVATATPYENVSFIQKENSDIEDTTSSTPDILVDINDADIDFDGKTDENSGEFEQTPVDPDNVIALPPIPVKPPTGNTSSSDSTSSKVPSSSKEETSSSTSSEDTSSSVSSNTSTDTSSDASSDVESDTSSTESSESSDITSSEDTSSEETSSEETSSNTSTDSSSETDSNVSSDTSSDTSSSGGDDTTQPDIDSMLTWDITLYVKQKNGTVIYGTASEIVARVIEAEIGSVFPLEALKAQAVASYAWLLNNGAMKKSTAPSGVPMKQTPDARAIQAVKEVKGTLITYENNIAQTYYYAYSAGFTANVQDIWTAELPYLQSVECPVDTELPYFVTTKTYTAEQIKNLILEKYGIDVSEMDKTEWIKPVEYDNNNTYCTLVEIGGVKHKGTSLRSKLFSNGIRSSAYTVEYDSETDSFIITCKGWGHGVGMSQEGARSYANQGWTYDQILAHFYPGTTLIKY